MSIESVNSKAQVLGQKRSWTYMLNKWSWKRVNKTEVNSDNDKRTKYVSLSSFDFPSASHLLKDILIFISYVINTKGRSSSLLRVLLNNWFGIRRLDNETLLDFLSCVKWFHFHLKWSTHQTFKSAKTIMHVSHQSC